MHPLAHRWPLFELRVVNGPTELRLPDDTDLAALAALAAGGVHDPAQMPFSTPWTDAPPAERARGVVQWHWRQRAQWRPDDWSLELVAVEEGRVVGTQSMSAREFALTRSFSTGSWVGRIHQGRGVGTRMRQAVLHLGFAGLGAEEARSAAFFDNPGSQRVSDRLGYRRDGTERRARRGLPAEMIRYVLRRAEWEAAAHPEVLIAGLAGCRSLFGIQEPAGLGLPTVDGAVAGRTSAKEVPRRSVPPAAPPPGADLAVRRIRREPAGPSLWPCEEAEGG